MSRRFRVERRGYSLHPWRIVDVDSGAEVYGDPEPYPSLVEGVTLAPIRMPLCYATKAAAIEGLGDLAGRLWSRLYEDAS